jgi:biopolymer transport protein ExbB/TolQ
MVPPALVATASGLVGAVAALNLSVLRRRRRED